MLDSPITFPKALTSSEEPNNMAPKKILLLGATGPAGIATIEHALASTRDVEVLVYARSPSKIPEELRADERVTILAGGELSDTAALRDAVAQKPDAIVSLLGPPRSELLRWMNPWGDSRRLVFAETYNVIVRAMKEFGVRRILTMGYVGVLSVAFSVAQAASA